MQNLSLRTNLSITMSALALCIWRPRRFWQSAILANGPLLRMADLCDWADRSLPARLGNPIVRVDLPGNTALPVLRLEMQLRYGSQQRCTPLLSPISNGGKL